MLCSLNTTAAGIFEIEVWKFYIAINGTVARMGEMGTVKTIKMIL
jgi:hypothetical protein